MLRREFFGLVSAATLAWPLAAQAQPSASSTSPDVSSPASFGVLPGRWVRKDGGYMITIKAVDPDGRLDASYANPGVLPFHTAMTTSEAGSSSYFLSCAPADTTARPTR